MIRSFVEKPVFLRRILFPGLKNRNSAARNHKTARGQKTPKKDKLHEKILTALVTATLLIRNAWCQITHPQTTELALEPTPQALILNAALPSEKYVDTSATVEQITADLKLKVDTAGKKKKLLPQPSRKRRRNPKKSRKCGNLILLLSQNRNSLPMNRMLTTSR